MQAESQKEAINVWTHNQSHTEKWDGDYNSFVTMLHLLHSITDK